MQTQKNVYDNPNLEKIFDLETLPVAYLYIPEAEWNKLLKAFDEEPEKNFWIAGVFKLGPHLDDIYDINSVTNKIQNIAIRVRGNSSRRRPSGQPGEPFNKLYPQWHQASFALQFDRFVPNQKFKSLSRLNLKYVREDPTRIREVYSFNLYQEAGVYSAPLLSMCRLMVYVQTDPSIKPAYFGIYKLMEFINEDYLDARKTFFGDDVPGDKTPFLWKGDNGASLASYAPDHIENRDVYDLRTNTSKRKQANAQLTDFVRNLVTLEGDALKNWANDAMDVKLLMKTYLINVICGNMDDYWYNANNYCFYFNTHGKFFFIPNDFDTTLGTGWGVDAGRQDIFNWGNNSNPLIHKLLSINEFAEYYVQAFKDLTHKDGPFYVDNSIERIKKWQELISYHIWDETFQSGCEPDVSGAGYCVNSPLTYVKNCQMPYEDSTAFWTSPENKPYKLLEKGDNNFFEVSGDSSRVSK